MIVLVMGRSGAGKTFACNQLNLPGAYFNADKVRTMFDDWDFSHAGRLRQVTRMKSLCEMSTSAINVVDMICPLKEMRAILKPDVIVYLKHPGNRIFKNTDSIFEEPTEDECKKLYIIS